MEPIRSGSGNPFDGMGLPPEHAGKRVHESSSDEDGKKLPHASGFSRNKRPALASALRSQVPDSAGAGDAAVLAGPFQLFERLSDADSSEYSSVYRVHNPHVDKPLAAKILEDGDPDSPAAEGHPDPLTHSLQQFRKIGDHPNINKHYGIASMEVGGVEKPALITDAGDTTLHHGIDVFEQARVDRQLTDQTYFGVVLPYLARSMFSGAAHCAKARVSHGDIDPANLLLFKDGRPPQLIDLHLSKEHGNPPQSLWPEAERAAANPFVAVYPVDSQKIAGTLGQLAAPAEDGGTGIELGSVARTAEVAALQALLNRIDGRSHPQHTPRASDFDFLQLGSDDDAREVLAALLK